MKRLLLCGGALALLPVAAAYGCYRSAFCVSRKTDIHRLPRSKQYDPLRPQMKALIEQAERIVPTRDVTIRSRDGLRLHARYYETAVGAPVHILFHGYRSSGLRDFSGGLPLALRGGNNVLLIDQRAHGESQGRCLTFGVLERFDCLDWANYAAATFGGDIVLVGLSMGAATVLMASELPLPPNVKGIIADCGYTSPEAIIRTVIRSRKRRDGLTYALTRLGAKWFGRFDLESAAAVTALRRCRVPVLLLHGEADRFVPCEMSRENYAACASRKTLFTVAGAPHGASYLVDPEGYTAAVRDFLASL